MVTAQPEPHVVKRYGSGRLYDAAAPAYVDAAQLRAMVRAGTAVMVLDAATGEDVTARVLAP